MKNKIKNILNKLGIYDVARKAIIKVYYPYKHYKIEKNVKDILLRITPIFEKNTTDWWLDYGTLLGCVREGRIIQNDIDLDFAVLPKSGSLQEDMEKAGFKITCRVTVEGAVVKEQYDIKGIGFDIFYYRKEDDKLIANLWYPKDYTIPHKESYKKGLGDLNELAFTYSKTKKVKFYGIDCKIPENYELYLSENYGDDFMTPNPNWSRDDEKNREVVQKEFKVEFYE
ncbi:MAG: hypothetical protein KGV44_10010 [Flavobacteriaceae bacterium]|nr:hypothetical protein [Flavobacteriaceae bacterium]